MGYSTLIDILGATMIGGTLMLTLFRLQTNTISSFFYYNSDLILQNSLIEIIGTVEADIKRIGYCANPDRVPLPTEAMVAADSTSVSFLSDVDYDGDADTVRYFVGPTSGLTATKNPRDRILYKQINGSSVSLVGIGNVRMFDLRYFDALGNPLSFPISNTGLITTLQVSIMVENPEAIDDNYSSAYWRQVRLASRNLTSR